MNDISDSMAKKTFELFTHGPEHHVIADLAARLAKAERERDELRHDVERHIAASSSEADRAEAAEAKLAKAERALEEAEKVISGAFEGEARRAVAQAISDDMARQDYADDSPLPDDLSWPWVDQGRTDFGSLADAALRAARKWMEERHD